MIRNFKYFIVFASAPGVLPEQNDWYWIQPWKVNEIKAYKKDHIVGSLFLACRGVPMLMKYIAGFAEVAFKNILPAPPLGLLFSFVFLFLSIGKL